MDDALAAIKAADAAEKGQRLGRHHSLYQRARALKRGSRKGTLLQLQIKHANRKALREDDVIHADSRKRRTVRGSGRWKSWLPSAVLQVASAEGSLANKNLGLAFSSTTAGSGKHAADVRAMVAQQVWSRQLAAASTLLRPATKNHAAWNQGYNRVVASSRQVDRTFDLSPIRKHSGIAASVSIECRMLKRGIRETVVSSHTYEVLHHSTHETMLHSLRPQNSF